MTQTIDQTDADAAAKEALDQYTREMVQWHFSPETGCPYWLDWAKEADWSPLKEVACFEDMMRFENFDDEVLARYGSRSIYSCSLWRSALQRIRNWRNNRNAQATDWLGRL